MKLRLEINVDIYDDEKESFIEGLRSYLNGFHTDYEINEVKGLVKL